MADWNGVAANGALAVVVIDRVLLHVSKILSKPEKPEHAERTIRDLDAKLEQLRESLADHLDRSLDNLRREVRELRRDVQTFTRLR